MKNTGKLLFGTPSTLARELNRPLWQGAEFVVLTDETVLEHCLPRLVQEVPQLQEVQFIEVPQGEECKCLEVATGVWQTLLEMNATRSTVLICLGGGSICDLGGYIAASYMRGMRHILVPTTLLAQVDAAIGGKTAINLAGIKNAIGHFYPAELTFCDYNFCRTLSEEQLLDGRMEMIKTAAIHSETLYTKLLHNLSLQRASILEAARFKQAVCEADPEDHSTRHILNFGHTFGHAIEMHSHLSHGTAVGLGMLVAFYLSSKKLCLDQSVATNYHLFISKLIKFPQYTLHDIEAMLPLMHHDKKNASSDSLHCVLLKDIGVPVIDVPVSDNEVRDAFLTLFGKKQ